VTVMTDEADRLLTPDEAAEFLGVTESTLATWRSTRRYNLPWVRVGRRIRYRLGDLTVWIEDRTENR